MNGFSVVALALAAFAALAVVLAIVGGGSTTVILPTAVAPTSTPPAQYVYYLGQSDDDSWAAGEFESRIIADPAPHPAYTCETVTLTETTTASKYLAIAIPSGHKFLGARVSRGGAVLAGQEDPCAITSLWSETASLDITGLSYKLRYTPDAQDAGEYVITVGVESTYTRYAVTTTGSVVTEGDFAGAVTSQEYRLTVTWPEARGAQHVSLAIPASVGSIVWVQACNPGETCDALNQRSAFGDAYEVTVGGVLLSVITSNLALEYHHTAYPGIGFRFAPMELQVTAPPAPDPQPVSATYYAFTTASVPVTVADFGDATSATSTVVTLDTWMDGTFEYITAAVPSTAGDITALRLCASDGASCVSPGLGDQYTLTYSGTTYNVRGIASNYHSFFGGGTLEITVDAS